MVDLLDDIEPEMIVAHGEAMLVFYSRLQWATEILTGRQGRVLGTAVGYQTRDEAGRAGRLRLAQRVYRPGGPDGLDVVDPRDRASHQRWLGQQARNRESQG